MTGRADKGRLSTSKAAPIEAFRLFVMKFELEKNFVNRWKFFPVQLLSLTTHIELDTACKVRKSTISRTNLSRRHSSSSLSRVASRATRWSNASCVAENCQLTRFVSLRNRARVSLQRAQVESSSRAHHSTAMLEWRAALDEFQAAVWSVQHCCDFVLATTAALAALVSMDCAECSSFAKVDRRPSMTNARKIQTIHSINILCYNNYQYTSAALISTWIPIR